MPTHPVRGTGDPLATGRGEAIRHIMVGLGLTVGAVALADLAARMHGPKPLNPEVRSDPETPEPSASKPPAKVFALIWPSLLMSLTLSGLRVWSAPRSAARTQALTLWGAVQALNAVWMALGPKRLGGRLAAVIACLGAAGAYVWRAKRVEAPTAGMVSPYVGWIGLVTEELRRKNAAPDATLH